MNTMNKTIALLLSVVMTITMIPLIGTWLKRNQDLSTEDLAQLIKGILQDGVLKQVTG